MDENQNLELEFRKVPSLKFLYEVNSDGTILRNVKSKRHIKIKTEYHHTTTGYRMALVNISNRTIRVMLHKVVAECWLGQRPEGMEIDHINRDSLDNRYTNLRYVTHSEQMRNRVLSDRIISTAKANCLEWTKRISVPVTIDGTQYTSICSAARYLSELHDTKVEHMRSKLKKRRERIYGHTITYSSAETRHCDHIHHGKE